MLVRPKHRKRFQAGRMALVGAMTLITSAATTQVCGAQSPADALETVYFPHSQFKIPFNVDARGTQPTQVQLWVSTDGGASWQMHGSANSNQKHFEFRAAAEGLYLFSVQTLDESGKAFPSPQPPMRIMIDTTKPQIALRPDVNASGQVVVDVRISEEHLLTDSVKLRYRTDQEVEWHEVQVDNLVAAGEIFEGQVTLDIDHCREIGFVATVADAASNIGDASAQYVMPRTAAMQDIKLASQRNGTDSKANSTAVPGAVNWPSSQIATNKSLQAIASPFAANNNSTGIAPQPTSPPSQSAASTSGQIASGSGAQNGGVKAGGWSVSGQLASGGDLSLNPPAPVTEGAASAPQSVGPTLGPQSPLPPSPLLPGPSLPQAATSAFGPDIQLSEPQAVDMAEELPAPRAIEGNLPTRPIQPRLVEKQEPAQQSPLGRESQPTTEPQPTAEKATPRASDLAETEKDRSPVGQAFHCNSQSFSLDYSLNAAAGSALADVELWGTDDGGSTWQKWGSDPDRQSPFDVQVANDGLFGFRMVIVSQSGKVSNRPRNGDNGDAWIFVDTHKPVGKITRAVYGEGHEAGMLVIDYNCIDDNLHDRPITLSYSETLDGPWMTIASALKNTGIYLWKADSDLPETIFLRLEAVDKAGNVCIDVLDLPINVHGLSPRGRIQGFRPIANPE